MAFIRVILIVYTGFFISPDAPKATSRIPFDLSKPLAKFELPAKLKEISGITWYKNNLLAAVQDEEGIIFLINSTNGKIQKEIRFNGPGDYESITFFNTSFYIMTSSGLLYVVNHLDPTIWRKFKTPLGWMNDIEGMCYDSVLDQLLVACKEQPSTQLTLNEKGKAIYAIDLSAKKLITPPTYTIKKKSLEPFLGEKPSFKPSGIAIDPITCNIYVLASVGKLLIVMSPDGTVLDVEKLSSKRFRQPEGITFSPDGDLFIANEASGKKARLYRFVRNSN